MSDVEQVIDDLLEQDVDQVDFGPTDPVEVMTAEAIADGVPEHVAPSIARYVLQHVPTGGFLKALLSNDLVKTVMKADLTNLRALDKTVRFLYNHAPVNCWMSPEAVKQWLQQ